MTSHDQIHDDVRPYYRAAASTRQGVGNDDDRWGANRYDDETLAEANDTAGEVFRWDAGIPTPSPTSDRVRWHSTHDGPGTGVRERRTGPTR